MVLGLNEDTHVLRHEPTALRPLQHINQLGPTPADADDKCMSCLGPHYTCVIQSLSQAYAEQFWSSQRKALAIVLQEML